MNDLVRRLTSRKLWIALFGIVVGVLMALYGITTNQNDLTAKGITVLQASVLGYLAAEGLPDAFGRLFMPNATKVDPTVPTAFKSIQVTDPEAAYRNAGVLDGRPNESPQIPVPGNFYQSKES